MVKKIFLLVTMLATILFLTSFSFAANNTKNLGNDIKDSLDKAGNNVGNWVNDVKDAGQSAMNNVGNATEGAMNDIGNMTNNGDSDDNYRYNGTTNGNYAASRTATFENATNNGTTWLWVILGVVALIIIGLSWYYMSDNKNNHNQQ